MKRWEWWQLCATVASVQTKKPPHTKQMKREKKRIIKMGAARAVVMICCCFLLFAVALALFSGNGKLIMLSSPQETQQNKQELLVDEILKLGNAGRSKRSSDKKKHRSLVCAKTRNDAHLREFIVRTLIAGFGHIVLYDNNRHDMDYNVSSVVEPFVLQRVVTVVPWKKDASPDKMLGNGAKNDGTRECIETYGTTSDWVAVLDTDEVLYMRHQGGENHSNDDDDTFAGIGILPKFLDDVETRSPNACNIGLAWKMVYGEHKVLSPLDHDGRQQLLLDSYTRICKVHSPKMLFRPERVAIDNPMLPHWTKSCSNEDGVQYQSNSRAFSDPFPEYATTIHLVHYYQKSVEEWLVKFEQSIAPYVRFLPLSYDGVTRCPQKLTAIDYHPKYVEVVRDVMSGLRAFDSVGDNGRNKTGKYAANETRRVWFRQTRV